MAIKINGVSVVADTRAGTMDSLILTGTTALTVSVGTTAQRPATPVNGMLRYNTDLVIFEFYKGGAWVASPTLTGTGASGTWGINVTGTAATATNSTNATNAGFLTVNNSLTYGVNGLAYFNMTGTAGNVATANSVPTSDWHHIIRMNHANATGYYVDIAAGLNSNSLFYRRITAGVANGWYKIWDETSLTNLNQLTNGPGYTTNTGTVTAVTATSPVVSSGGTAPVISMPAATTSVAGHLTAADWTTFNNKAPTANPTFSGTGTFDIVSSTNNGNGTNFKVGDDAWIGDINVANTLSIKGTVAPTLGYVRFGSSTNGLGFDGTNLVYGANSVWHSGNLTNLNQLTNGPGYATGGGTASGTNTGDQTTISGNAGSANTAIGLVYNDGPRDLSNRLPNWNARSVYFDFVGATTANGTGSYGGVMTYAPWAGTTTSTGDASYQLAFANNSGINASGMPKLSIRNGIDSTWNAWHVMIHSGNISSYTSAGTASSLTMNSSGAGAASGTTFNGGTAQTISYNTVGAPSTTGANASGTWGIGITGIAASVAGVSTSAATIAGNSTQQATAAVGSGGGAAFMSFHRPGSYAAQFGIDTDNILKFGGWSAGAVAWPIAKGDSGSYALSITGSAATSSSVTGLQLNSSASPATADNVVINQLGYCNTGLFGQTDGALYSSAHSSPWVHQIYGDFRTGQIAVRGKNNNVWQAYRAVLDAGNYSSYALSLSGGTLTGPVVGKTSGIASGTAAFRADTTGGSYASMYTRPAPFHTFASDTGSSYAPSVTHSYNHNGAYAGVYSIGVLNYGATSSGAFNIHHINSGGGEGQAWTFDGATGSFSAPGNVTAYSDERLKKDWSLLPVDFIDQLARVKHGTYTRTESGERQVGVSAQSLREVIPEAVVTGGDENQTLSVAYGNAALASAVELAKRVVDQEIRIAKLESLVELLIHKLK